MRGALLALAALPLLAACETGGPVAAPPVPEGCPNAAACELTQLLAADMWEGREAFAYRGVEVERIEAEGPVLLIESRFPLALQELAATPSAEIEEGVGADMKAAFCDGSPASEAFFALGAAIRLRYLAQGGEPFFDQILEGC
ncbi:hypothetical protein [Pseudoroseicyclus sp. CXY001]|uniref:hypothetical protein n=1 Tax=Pseudoroseicyclus sp. CXY001 TaxID=3242492 RepID=UPI003570C978